MKKLIIFICTIVISSAVYSQSDWELSKLKFNNDCIVHYSDSLIKFQFTYEVPNKKTDKWYYWYDTILHKTRGGYYGKLLDGYFRSFDNKGNMLSTGIYSLGLKDKFWSFWDHNGELIRTENWKRGMKQGEFKYYENGKIIKKASYRKDKLDGYSYYFDNDTIIKKQHYKNGELIIHKSFCIGNLFNKEDE